MYLKNGERFLENNVVRNQEANVTIKSLHHYHIHISLKSSLFTCALSANLTAHNYRGCATVII
jgi:hypothetical protein